MAALAGNLRDDLGSGRIATNYSGADDETGYQIVSAMATAAAAPVNEDARQSRSTSEAPVLLLSQVFSGHEIGQVDGAARGSISATAEAAHSAWRDPTGSLSRRPFSALTAQGTIMSIQP
ncbi:unnamed protein product [Calypogeia fissa]